MPLPRPNEELLGVGRSTCRHCDPGKRRHKVQRATNCSTNQASAATAIPLAVRLKGWARDEQLQGKAQP